MVAMQARRPDRLEWDVWRGTRYLTTPVRSVDMLDAEEVKKMGFEDRQCWEDDRSEEEEFDEDRAYEEHRELELFGD